MYNYTLVITFFFQIYTVLENEGRPDRASLMEELRRPKTSAGNSRSLLNQTRSKLYQSKTLGKKNAWTWMFRAYWLWYSYGRWRCSWSCTRFATTWIRNTIQLANFLRGRCRRTGCSRSFRASYAALETRAIPYRNTKKFLLTKTPR